MILETPIPPNLALILTFTCLINYRGMGISRELVIFLNCHEIVGWTISMERRIYPFNPILDGGGGFLPLQTNFPKYLKNCAGRRPTLFYMWLNISPRHPVKISAWYKYENFFTIFHRKMVDTKIVKIGSKRKNREIFKM